MGRLNRGGAETSLMSVYRYAKKYQLAFDFVVHDSNVGFFEPEVIRLGGTIYRSPAFSLSNVIKYQRFWREFLRSNQGQWDIVHFHVRSTAALILPIAKKYGFPTIVHSHSTSSGSGLKAKGKDLLQFPLRYLADYYIACSRSAGKWLFGKSIIASEKFQVVENAIEGQAYFFNATIREQLRRELHLDNSVVIGNVSRLIASKNHDFMLEWFQQFKRIVDRAKLLLIGSGERQNHLQEKILQLGLSEDVILLSGDVPIGQYLNAMDVFLFPSKFEGLGNVAIEAQFNGLPVVMSDRIPEEANLSDQVTIVALDAEMAQWNQAVRQAAMTGRQSISEGLRHYEAETVAEKLATLYQRLL